MNRIERIKDKIIGMTSPEDQMMEIMGGPEWNSDSCS